MIKPRKQDGYHRGGDDIYSHAERLAAAAPSARRPFGGPKQHR